MCRPIELDAATTQSQLMAAGVLLLFLIFACRILLHLQFRAQRAR